MSTSAMHVAKTGLTAQQYKMQVIANNLANVNTTGFKRDRANFESLFYQIVKNAGSQTGDNTSLTSPLAVGTGVKVVSTQKLFTQGGLVSTDNSLDLAIDGSGFFQALLPDGEIDPRERSQCSGILAGPYDRRWGRCQVHRPPFGNSRL